MKIKSLMCVAVLAMTAGCTTMQDFAKAAASFGFAAGREAAKEQWPGMRDEFIDAAEDLVNAGVDRACEFTEKKTNELADKWIASYENRTGINVQDFDANGDGSLSFGEALAGFEMVANKSKEREERGEDPIPWTTRYGETAVLLAMLLTGIKGTKIAGGKVKGLLGSAVKKAVNGDKPNG